MHSNVPYQQMLDRGYFIVVERKYITPDGRPHINTTTLVYN